MQRKRIAVEAHPLKAKPNHSKLTKAQRDRLRASEFALPEKRQYPIPEPAFRYN